MGHKRGRTRTGDRPDDDGDPSTSSSSLPGAFLFHCMITFWFALEDVESESTAERL